jgi:ribonucleoside-diphosphate reductase beta chain
VSIINNSKTNPNKILPITYQWARKHYKDGIANNWVPEEIPMQDDVEQWKSGYALTENERRMVLWNLGFFSTAESLTANNIVLAIYNNVTNPECRQYLLRQAFEEAVHVDTFVYACDTLGLDPNEIYNMYMDIPSIKRKDDFVVELTKNIMQPGFTTETQEDIRNFLRDLIGFYVIMEGIFFYAGFAMMLGLRRRNKMTGTGQQFEYILRDESVHLAFGNDLIHAIRRENPGVWTPEFEDEIKDLIYEAVLLEKDYVYDACPNGIVGVTPETFCQYVEYIADKRLDRLGMDKLYYSTNPFPWLSQSMDLPKEKNFFETRVTEYQVSSLEW